MNVLMLNYEWPPIGGGGGQAHLNLLRQYAGRKDLRVDVLSCGPEPGFVTERFAENVTLYKAGIRKRDLHYWRRGEVLTWMAKASWHCRRLVRRNHYDLAHAFFAFPTGWLCYRQAGRLPYILSLRGSDVPGYNARLGLDYRLMAGLFRRIWSGAAAVVANSHGLQSLALEFMPGLDIGVIPNGIDTERFHPVEGRDAAVPLQALTVCRLIGRKRIDLLIGAVARARELGLSIELTVAGDGNLMGQLQRLAKDLGVAERVHFMGGVPPEQMPQLYRQSDLFIMSSAHEGMSNAMLEAMASGLPIVTTRCEGVDELIADNGRVVDGPDGLVQALQALARDPGRRREMGAASRSQAERFTWSAVADRYVQYYQRVSGGK